jgi:hypothetical protein
MAQPGLGSNHADTFESIMYLPANRNQSPTYLIRMTTREWKHLAKNCDVQSNNTLTLAYDRKSTCVYMRTRDPLRAIETANKNPLWGAYWSLPLLPM